MTLAIQLLLLKDVARLSGHSIHTIKFYLKIGLIHEVGRSPETRFRYFDQTTLERLDAIRQWRRQGKSLADIQDWLQLNDAASSSEPAHSSGPA